MAALTVGELSVELEARTREFNSRMQGAERRIERFEGRANRSTKAAGLSFRGLVGPIAAVAGALATLGAIRGFGRVAQEAVQGAAAFEGFEVRLRGLLGSQEAANTALENFVTLSTRTPFAVEQIVSGAATLASVAGGSREELEELTAVSANLAAVTGLSFDEAAGNLQRALAAGIAAADLFRDRGVRKLIEEVQGIPDLTKVPLEEQRQLFKDTFGPDALTPFATAAQDLSTTLGGALSNIADASDNARRSLGEALSPAVFATARGVIIPFFEEVKVLIDENREAITDFAVDGLGSLIRGFAGAARSGAAFLETLSAIGVDLGDIADLVTILTEIFGIFFEAVRLGFNTLLSGVALLAEGIGKVGQALGLVSEADVALLERFRTESFEKLASDAEDFGAKAEEALFQASLAVVKLADDGDEVSDFLNAAADAADRGADELERQAAAFRAIRAEQKAASDESSVLAAKRKSDVDALVAGINAEFDELDRELNELILTGKLDLDSASLEDASAEAGETFTSTVSGIFAEGFGATLEDLGFGRAVDIFAEGLTEISTSLFREGMTDVLKELGGEVAGIFEGTGLGDLFSGLGGEGGFDFGAGASAAIGLGGQILAGALRGTDVSVRNPAIRSAVTSTQAVRGIVAGPSSIPVAQVGDAIRDAQGAQVSELRRSNRLLEAILEAVRSGVGGTIDVGEAISDAIAGEFTGSVALG